MIPFEPLLAIDVGGIIGVIVVIIMVITAIGNIIAKITEEQKKAQRRPRAQQQPRPQAGADGGGGGGIGDEITEFLRRAAQGQGAEPQPPQAAPPPPRPVRQRPSVAAQPVEAEIVAEDRGSRAVGAGIDTSKFDRRDRQLGDEVIDADQVLDERVHDVFDHDISDLAQTRGTAESATPSKAASKRRTEIPPTAAAGFAAMLSNADNIRQAIIISEILNRPLDRWEC